VTESGQAGLRVLRAAALAAVTVGLALVAHLLAGALVTRGEALLACAVALVRPALPTHLPLRVAAVRAADVSARVLAGALAHVHLDRRGPPVAALAG
jgi:hypothetical protein